MWNSKGEKGRVNEGRRRITKSLKMVITKETTQVKLPSQQDFKKEVPKTNYSLLYTIYRRVNDQDPPNYKMG
jgi:hypothetical protein